MRKLICILLLALPWLCEAQQSYRDSMRQVYLSENDPQKKIDAFYEIAAELSLDNPDQGFIYADSLEMLSRKYQSKDALAMAKHLRGYAHQDQGDYELALQYFREELALFVELDDRNEQGTVYNNLGSLWGDIGDADSTIYYYLKSLEVSEETGDRLGSSITQNNIGQVYSDEGVYEKAEEHFLKALQIRQEMGLEKRYTHCYSNLATLYQRMGDFARAEEYAMKGLELAEKYEQIALAGIICNNMATDLIDRYEEAESLPWLEKAHKYFRQLNNEHYETYVYSNYTRAYAGMGNGDMALQMADKGFEIVERLGLEHMKELYFDSYSKAHEAKGNYRQALDYWKKYSIIVDSLHKLDNTEATAKMEARYETQRKEARLAQAELELEQKARQNQLLLFGGLLVVAALFGSFQYWRSKARLKRKEAEMALSLKKAETETLKELDEAKSNFFANISHEFRTPLTLILGPLKKAKEKGEATIPPGHIDMMQRNAERLQQLIDQLLDLSKLESGSMQLQVAEGAIVPYLRAMVHSFESLAERQQVQFDTSFPNGQGAAFFDKDKLEKILVNLLSNAFKFTPAGGKITVNSTLENDLLHLRVADTGPGISSADLPKIFDRFYRVSSSDKQGTGIGLSLVKELVELHQGTIEVKSEWGKGTVFEVSLPVGKEAFGSPAFLSSAVGSSSVRKLQFEHAASVDLRPQSEFGTISDGLKNTLLIVEDSPDLRRFIAETMQGEYQVLLAENGKKGLAAAIEKTPDLIISDVMMPEMDGFEMCEKLKTDERTSHIPVILLTAKAGQEHKLEGLETGADDYLTKPFDEKELQVRAKNLVGQRKRLKERFSDLSSLKLRPGEITVTSTDQKFIEKVTAAIEKNMDNEFFSVEDLAAEVAFSRSQLHRKLKALIGKSPNQLIRDFRMARAKELLEKGAGNVSEVAIEVGYSSVSYFTRSFKQAFGILPSEV